MKCLQWLKTGGTGAKVNAVAVSCKLYIKKLQAIHLMLHKRWCKMAKIKKYKPELMY